MAEDKKPSVTAYFDFETYNLTNYKFGEQPIEEWDKKEKLDRPVAVYGAALWWEGTVYSFMGVNALENFWDKLIHLAKGKLVTLIAHNCAYDFAFINEYVHTKGCAIKSFKAAQTNDDRAWLWASIQVDDIDLVFKDTWIWDKTCSLQYYSDILNKETRKGKLKDYEKWNLFQKDGGIYFYDKNGELKELEYVEERTYLEDDVKLLPLVRNYIFETKKLILKSDFMPDESEWITPFWKINQKITKASFAKSCLEIAMGEYFYQGFKVPVSEEFYHLQVKSYIGGFTAGNKYITELDLEKDDIVSLDVNSLYPSIMAEWLPYGEALYEKPKGKYCTWYKITGTRCKYKNKYDFLDCPIISVKFQEWLEDNKEFEECGYVPEFIILKDYFDIITEYCEHDLKVIEEFYQVLTDKASQIVKDAYAMRVLVKHTNKPLADSIKLFLNSVYGKFGEKVHYFVIEWNEELQCWDETIAKKHDHYTNLLTGLYICSQGRIKLMKGIKTEIENGNTFLYADTDSIKLIVKNPIKLEIDPDKLGAWKNEGSFNVWRYPLKRKRYYSYNTFTGQEKITCGGFAKFMIAELPYEDKLRFFTANTNVLIKNGKRTRYLGEVRRKRKKEEAKLNKFALTKLQSIDISTTNDLLNPDFIMEEIDNKWTMRKA